MKQKHKKGIWLLLAVFITSSFYFPSSRGISHEAQAATISGYALEGIAFYADSEKGKGLLPVYRLFKPATTDHIYTTSEEEKASIISIFGYTLEETSFYAYPASQEGLSPVYRLYNESSSSRLYTTSEEEKANAISNLSFISEDIAFYASASAQASLVPVYRFYNKATGGYLYTASEEEKIALLKESSAPTQTSNLGPEISVGLWNASKSSLGNKPFKIKANKNYNIRDKDGNMLSQVTGALETHVSTYTTTTLITKKSSDRHKKKKKSKKKHSLLEEIMPTAWAADKVVEVKTEYLEIDHSMPDKKLRVQEIYIDSTDGDNSDMIFDVSRPDSSYDQYRGKIKIKYTDDGNIWIINILPMEQYVWGMGETTGTGPKEHTKVMTAIFRTYGYWYMENATKYLPYGFRIRSDSGSQIYLGYEWEKDHPAIKQSAEETKGTVAMYGKEVALTPYSSWTDGRTRSFKERWGSNDYPWCKSVSDPYGDNKKSSKPSVASMTTEQLVAAGNHMVGMSANGSLRLAGGDYEWDYKKILNYYYTGIDLTSKY